MNCTSIDWFDFNIFDVRLHCNFWVLLKLSILFNFKLTLTTPLTSNANGNWKLTRPFELLQGFLDLKTTILQSFSFFK